MGTPLYTLGHGDRPIEEFLELLSDRGVEYVVDVRSFPYSKRFPDYGQEQFRRRLKVDGFRYLFLGKELGGRPDDASVYVDGKVSYSLAAERIAFKKGLKRLLKAVNGGHRVCLVCSEKRPETCHRTKLVAEELVARGVEVVHVDRDGCDAPHTVVMSRIEDGQLSLAGASGLTSVGTYLENGRRA